jgi:hypothetical protein
MDGFPFVHRNAVRFRDAAVDMSRAQGAGHVHGT